MRYRIMQTDGRQLTDCALAQDGRQALPEEREALVQCHDALKDAAKSDFGIRFEHTAVPEWIVRELDPQPWHKRNDALQLYHQKELSRAHHLFGAIRPLLEDVPEGKIVDIGARSGFFARLLRTRSELEGYDREVCGLDLDQRLITDHTPFDNARGPDAIVQHYDGKHMPYADGDLAAATLNFTLHHIEKPSRHPSADSPAIHDFLSETNRVLKPGGVLIITEDFMGKTKAEREAGNPYAAMVLKTDDVFYPFSLGCQRSQEEWKALLQQHGFTVEVEKHICGYNAAGFPSVELLMKARKTA